MTVAWLHETTWKRVDPVLPQDEQVGARVAHLAAAKNWPWLMINGT